MFRISLAVLVLALIGVMSMGRASHAAQGMNAQQAGGGVALTPCANIWKNEPIVVYDVSGNAFGGPVHKHLAVYNSGIVSFTEIPVFGDPISMQTVVDVETAFGFLNALRDAGAFQRCDGHNFVTDTPLTTLTLLRGATDARAHTLSWFDGSPFAEIVTIVNDFIDTHVQ